jgi:hypothetical protein
MSNTKTPAAETVYNRASTPGANPWAVIEEAFAAREINPREMRELEAHFEDVRGAELS